MRNSRLSIAGLIVAAGASTAFAGTVTMTDPGNNWRGDWNGGAFRATTVSGFNGVNGGPGGTATSFLTFCLEYTENIQLGNTYNTIISDRAMNGGGGGGSNGDPISSVTAAIYSEFRRGGADSFGLSHINLTGGDLSNVTQAIQRAIWFEEAEIESINGLAQQIHNWGVSFAGANLGFGIGNVRVLQLYNPDGSRTQDQLTEIPLPSAAFAGLAGLGLVAARRRRA